MLIEIIRNTPRWVFLLFIVLHVTGYRFQQTSHVSANNYRRLNSTGQRMAVVTTGLWMERFYQRRVHSGSPNRCDGSAFQRIMLDKSSRDGPMLSCFRIR